MHNGNMDTKNFECTICYEIFVYPVCLPCNHRFCKACLDKHIENNTMSCPICRFRVSNWLRQLRRNNSDVVDKPFWDTVQKLYPKEVERRINGYVDYQTSPTSNDTPTRKLAEPGEVQKEYQQFLQKELEEKRREDEENFRLSEAMIRMIEEDERREEEERKQQLLRDEELARRLEEEAASDSDRTVDELPLLNANSCCTPTRSAPLPCLETASSSKDPCCPQSSESHVSTPSTSRGTHGPCTQSPLCLDTQSTSKENVFAKFFKGSASPSSNQSSDKNASQSPLQDSKTASISNKELSHFTPVHKPSRAAKGSKNKKKETVPPSSRCSSGCDSIGQELNHFKPIRSSPTTPPKDGSRGPVPQMVVAQRGVGVPDLNILPLMPLELLAADVSLDELKTSINLEKQLEEDRRLAMEMQNQLNEEMNTPAKADYNLRKRKRPSGNMKKKGLLDRNQTTLDNLLIK